MRNSSPGSSESGPERRRPKRLPSKPVYRVHYDVKDDLRSSVAIGLFVATGFSATVLVLAVLRGSMTYDEMGGLRTWQVVLFYYGAGLVGGAMHGLLRPFREHYWGKLLTAYLLLTLVYGGGTVVFWPMFSVAADTSSGLTLRFMLILWAVVNLGLAPVAVKVLDG